MSTAVIEDNKVVEQPTAIERDFDSESNYKFIFNIEKIIGCTFPIIFDLIHNKKKYISQFQIKKSNGEKRNIIAPIGQYKRTLNWIKTRVFNSYKPSNIAFGYVKKVSGIDVAKALCRAKSKAEADFKDFFPSIKIKNILNCLYGNKYMCKQCAYYGRFCEGGCTSNLYKNREYVKNKNYEKITCPEVLYFFSKKWRDDNPNYISLFRVIAELTTLDERLCQGFPTSPVISNIVMKGFDKSLIKFAEKHELRAARYSDNVFVVSDKYGKKELDRLFKPFIFKKIKNFGFNVNYDKYNVVGNSRRMTCLGININEHPNINKQLYKLKRAILHRAIFGCHKEGIDINPIYDLGEFKSIAGWWNYFAQINPKKAEKHIKQVREAEKNIMKLCSYKFESEKFKDFKGIMIWPDGGAKGNKRNSGYGGYASFYNMNSLYAEESNLTKLCSDKFEQVTNNQMELMGIISSLRSIIKKGLHISCDEKKILIVSDSNYCIQCINSYLTKWRAKRFKKKGGIKNIDLWKLFIKTENQLKNIGFNIQYCWTPRSSFQGNILADKEYNIIVKDVNSEGNDMFETIKRYFKNSPKLNY